MKFSFIAGVAVGFVLGSRAGRTPYEQLEARLRGIGRRPEVQQVTEQVRSTVQDQVGTMKDRAVRAFPSGGKERSDVAPEAGRETA